MKFKKLVKLKNHYRIGFDVDEEDFIIMKNMFGKEVHHLRPIDITTDLEIKKHLKLVDKEVEIVRSTYDANSGFIYFNINPQGTYLKHIKDKYNIK